MFILAFHYPTVTISLILFLKPTFNLSFNFECQLWISIFRILYSKTSTGFGPSGAAVDDVRLMREVVGTTMGVKAAGGIRTREDAEEMIRAGANRIGASASIAIVKGE